MAVYVNGHPGEVATNNSGHGNLTRGFYHNYTNYTLIDEQEVSFYKYLYRITAPALFTMIIVVGLIGNGMVVGVIISKRKMRTTVNLLLLNLALSDLTFLTVCVPFQIYHYAANNWNMGDVMCKLSQFLLYVTVYVTVYTLILIAAVRFYTIVYPTTSVRLRTKRNICVAIGVIWGIMLIVNVPILMIYRVKETKCEHCTHVYRYCGMEDKPTGQLLFLTFFILTYVMPLSVITTFYFLIMKFLHTSSRNNSLHSSSRSASSRGGSDRASHAMHILMCVCLVFGLSWLPLHSHLLVVYFGKQPDGQIYEIFRVLCHCLAYANSSMNPIIYNYVSKDFRKSFREFAPCYRWTKHRENEYDLRSRNSIRHTSMKEAGSFI